MLQPTILADRSKYEDRLVIHSVETMCVEGFSMWIEAGLEVDRSRLLEGNHFPIKALMVMVFYAYRNSNETGK